MIWGESTNITLYIMPPTKPRTVTNDTTLLNSDILEALPSDHICRTFMTNEVITGIEFQILFTEYTPLRPFLEVLLMGEVEFRLYGIQLLHKLPFKINPSETYLFSTPQAKGFVHVTELDNAKVRVSCAVESAAKHIDVGFNFRLSGDKTNNVLEIILLHTQFFE